MTSLLHLFTQIKLKTDNVDCNVFISYWSIFMDFQMRNENSYQYKDVKISFMEYHVSCHNNGHSMPKETSLTPRLEGSTKNSNTSKYGVGWKFCRN